jgi:hypothetical protein
VTTRTLARAGTVVVLTSAATLIASPAWAIPDDGAEPGTGLTVMETVLIYIGIPAALFAIIALLVWAPSLARGPRYRPGLSWAAEPVWFGGPADAEAAVAAATPNRDGGGTSARW